MAKDHNRQPKKVNPVQVTICGWLLVLQAAVLFVVGVYHFHLNDGPRLFSTLFAQWIRGQTPVNLVTVQRFVERLLANAASAQLFEALVESAVMFALTILALWSGIGFLRTWPIAWISGLVVQIGVLVTALTLYFSTQPFHIVFLFAPGIFMVLYLNYADVHTFFNQQPSSPIAPEPRVRC